MGAVALKNAVYALPRREECLEDFQWVAQEAVAGKGEAFVCEAEFLERRTDETLVAQFRSERDADYAALAEEIRSWKREGGSDLPSRAARARKRLEEIERIDFFDAPGRRTAGKLVGQLETRSRRPRPDRPPRSGSFASRTWVTRRGVHIDRIASAWLIRRFLDPEGAVSLRRPEGAAGKRASCASTWSAATSPTRATAARSRRSSRGSARTTGPWPRSAEIVHDIDLKDEKFGRSEAAGVERLVTGLLLANPADEDRFERGTALFDDLYESFRARRSFAAKEVRS